MNSTTETADPQPAADDTEPPASWMVVFSTAIQFLTRIPVQGAMSGSASFYYAALRRSVVFFPIVGGLIGVVTALACVIGDGVGLSPMAAALIALAAEATLTGAFHEDAFADTWDALGGGWTRDQVLEIMKDSRLGTYGTIGLVLGVGIRAVVMADLLASDPWIAAVAIVAAASLSRLAIVGMMASTRPITDRNSQAKDVSGTQTVSTLLIAGLISCPFWISWIAMLPSGAVIGCLGAVVILFWFRRKLLRRIGGTTGDTLGCSAYLTQLVLLIAASVSP